MARRMIGKINRVVRKKRQSGSGVKSLRRMMSLFLFCSLLLFLLPNGLPSAVAATKQISIAYQIVKIEAGENFVIALMDDGTVYSWGNNSYGQYFAMALKTDGTVYVWGRNNSGQLGLDTSTSYYTAPTRITSLSSISKIAAGTVHSLALNSSGRVYAWGDNSAGRLGRGFNNYTMSRTPVQISSISGIGNVAAGGKQSFAIANNGKIYGWGYNYDNQLGINPKVNFYYNRYFAQWEEALFYYYYFGGYPGGYYPGGYFPGGSPPSNLEDLYYLSAIPMELYEGSVINPLAMSAGINHTIELRNTTTVNIYGQNSYGQRGSNIPQRTFAAAAAGSNHSLLLKTDGTLLAFGRNHKGQIGNGSTANSVSVPFLLSLNNIEKVFAGGDCTFALTSEGDLYTWGDNTYGQVATASSSYISTPTKYTGFPTIQLR